jgi:hypothetical protein
LFGEEEEDLFSDAPKPKKVEAKTAKPVVKQVSSRLSVGEKTRRFNELFAQVEVYLDKDLVGAARRRTPPLKHSVWTHMLQLSTQEEQLERMTHMFGRWKDVTGSGLNEQFAELFVGTCYGLLILFATS